MTDSKRPKFHHIKMTLQPMVLVGLPCKLPMAEGSIDVRIWQPYNVYLTTIGEKLKNYPKYIPRR